MLVGANITLGRGYAQQVDLLGGIDTVEAAIVAMPT